MLVGLVNRPVDQPELHDRAVVLDEPGIGGTAARARLRPPAGHPLHGAGHDLAERAGRRQEALAGYADVQLVRACGVEPFAQPALQVGRSEEHTPELPSLMRISYADF